MEQTYKELTMTREFDAPRDLVYKAWIDPKMVEKWWAPKGATSRIDVWDTKPGGKINLTMIAGEELGPMAGQEWPMGGEFIELVENERIVFEGDALVNGKVILQNRTTVTFEDEGQKTKMTVHVKVTNIVMPDAEGPLSGMEMGWNQQLDKLVDFIKGEAK